MIRIASALPDAEAIVELVAIDETQLTTAQISIGTVPPGAATALDLPIRYLPRPQAPLRVAGVLSVLVSLRLPADGGAVPDAEGPELISYHAEGASLRLYDGETRRRDFNGGALDAAVAAAVPPGANIAAAYIGPTLPLDWRPPDDGEPDPDHVATGVEP